METFQVITANRLRDGAIVWMNQDSGWVERVDDATVAAGDEIDALLKKAETDVEKNVVVEVYPVEVTGSHEPLSAREKVRAAGPSILYGEDAVPTKRTDFDI